MIRTMYSMSLFHVAKGWGYPTTVYPSLVSSKSKSETRKHDGTAATTNNDTKQPLFQLFHTVITHQ